MFKDYSVVAWGGYQYFSEHIDDIKNKVKIEYIYGNIEYIKAKEGYQLLGDREGILTLKQPMVVICVAKVSEVKEAAKWCRDHKIPCIHMDFLFNKSGICGKYLKAIGGEYRDENNNLIKLSQKASDEIFIDVRKSKNAKIVIGAVSVKERVKIAMFGHDAQLNIGDGTTMVYTDINVNTGGKVSIGKHCMFAMAISIKQSDQHLIFDKSTHERINYPRDIVIGNHVWIGREAQILGGAEIGDGSVCGARTVTSGKFPSNVIIAGCPARVVRENVVWARDLVETSDFDTLEQCKDQNGLLYPEKDGLQPFRMKKRKDPLEEMIIHLYQSGVTTVGIAKLIEKMYGQYYVPKK